MVSNSSNRYVPPLVADERRKETSRLIAVFISILVLLAIVTLSFAVLGFMHARRGAQLTKRATAIRGIAQALVIAEQGGMQIDASSDWKKALIDNGYIADEMFHHAAAVNGVMQYRIIWRGDATGSSGNATSWLCIYEYPASLRSGDRVNIMYASNQVASATRSELAEVVQHELRTSGVELSESALQELSKR